MDITTHQELFDAYVYEQYLYIEDECIGDSYKNKAVKLVEWTKMYSEIHQLTIPDCMNHYDYRRIDETN